MKARFDFTRQNFFGDEEQNLLIDLISKQALTGVFGFSFSAGHVLYVVTDGQTPRHPQNSCVDCFHCGFVFKGRRF